jgi:hypothetical protein
MAAILSTQPVAAPTPFVVKGQVRETDGTPIAGVAVQAYDQDLRLDTLLGQAQTNQQGAYSISYQPSQFKRPGKTSADLYVKASDPAGKQVAESPVWFHAPATAQVDLTRDNQPFRGPSEIRSVEAKLAPILQKLAPEDLTAADITYLIGETGLKARQVEHYSVAAQLAKTTGIDSQAFYGLARKALPTDLTNLLATDPATQRQAINTAAAQNLVPPSLAAQTDTIVSKLQSTAITQTLAPNAFRIGGTLSVALPNAAAQNTFLTTFQQNKGSGQAFWQALPKQPGFDANTVASSQLMVQLSTLAQYHAPLVSALFTQHQQGQIKSLSDLAKLSPSDWVNLLNTKSPAGAIIGVPAGVPGANAADQIQNYANALARRMEVAFPTVAAGANLAKSKLPYAQELSQFLAANADFDIASTNAVQYLSGKNPSKAVAQQLPALQRVFKVAPRFSQMEPLLAAGLTSARAITRVPRTQFLKNFSSSLGGDAEAQTIYTRAQVFSAAVVNLYGNYATGLNQYGPHVLPSAPTSSPQIPDWAALFGSADYCACQECRSVLGPAAYLVDLLHEFVDVYLGDGGSKKGTSFLFARRPDINTLKLSCENTNTTLPYIDLVNELLEDAVSPGTAQPHDTTDGASEDLAAIPEYLNQNSYGVLSQQVFPWILPFDLGLSQARIYLANLQVQRYQLMETFEASPASPDPTDGTFTRADAVACDYLNLSALGWKIIIGAAPSQPWELWGVTQAVWQGTWLAAGGGPTVQMFLNQAGIGFQDLVDLLTTRFVQGLAAAGKPIIIQWNDTATESCDTTKAQIINLTQAALAKIVRFLRLRQQLGCSVLEMDEIVTALNPADLSAVFLGQVVAADRLRKLMNLSWTEICSWWGLIPTLPDVSGGTSLYQRLFLNPATITPLDSAFALNATGTELADPSHFVRDPTHQPTVLGGLQIGASDLALLLSALPLATGAVSFSASGGTAPYTWSVTAGQLPPGLSLSPSGAISGTPTASGVYTFTVQVADSAAQQTSQAFTINVNSPLSIVTASLPSGSLNVAYSPQPALTLGNLSELFRAASMARALGLSASDYLSISTLLSLNLWNPTLAIPNPGIPSQPSPFDPAHLADAQWVANQISFIQSSGFRLAEIKYLLLDQGAKASGLAPASADLAQQLTAVRSGLAAILAQNPETSGQWPVLSQAFAEQQLAPWLQMTVTALDVVMATAPGAFPKSYLEILRDSKFVTSTTTIDAVAVDSALSAPVPPNPATAPFLYYQTRVLLKLKKFSVIVNRLALQTAELAWLVKNAAPNGWLDLNALPAAGGPVPSLYVPWTRLVLMCQLRNQLVAGQPFTALMPDTAAPPPEATYLAVLSGPGGLITAWPPTDLQILAGAQGLNLSYPGDFWNPATFGRLKACFFILSTLGASATQVAQWINVNLTIDQANDITSAVKGQYSVAQWPAVGKSLREKQRDALVAYLVFNSQAAFNQQFTTPDDLFGYFLIDNQMSACMQTSRIVQATQSVQLFISRCLMNLEPGIVVAPGAAAVWVWMKAYRLWQANREVFLYPENWLDPALRDDMTDFFKDLQKELHQNDVTEETVEAAYLHYLQKLDGVARLRVCGMYHHLDPANLIDVVYVFARTEGTPPVYYYRQFVNSSYWTPWEQVQLDIPGVDVIPVVYNRRLYVFWPVLKLISGSTGTTAVPQPGDPAFPTPPPPQWVQVQIAWSQYGQDKWTAKKISDGPPLFVPVANDAYTGETTLLNESLNPVGPSAVLSDGSVDPSWFAFKAIPPASTDSEDALQVECFIACYYSGPIQ